MSSLSMFICLDNLSFLFTRCAHFYSGQNGLFFNVTMSFIIFWDFVEFSEINTWINLLFYVTSFIIFWDFVGFSWINTWINLLQQWTFFNFLFSRYTCAFNQVLLLKLSTFPQIHHIFTIHTCIRNASKFIVQKYYAQIYQIKKGNYRIIQKQPKCSIISVPLSQSIAPDRRHISCEFSGIQK